MSDVKLRTRRLSMAIARQHGRVGGQPRQTRLCDGVRHPDLVHGARRGVCHLLWQHGERKIRRTGQRACRTSNCARVVCRWQSRDSMGAWAGNRDKQGYATGFGTLTWYTAQGAEYATYYGNMVNGKFEGPVNAHVGRQTAHAYFVDGNRETAWARGRAPANMNVPPELVAKRRKAEAEQTKPREE